MKPYDIAIIGAGPAGIMASLFAAKNGAKVVLIEKNDIIGRKILATGNGRCNLTNKFVNVTSYHGDNPSFVEPVFSQFGSGQTVAFFESLGVVLKEEDRGRIFPRTNQASTIVQALEHELSENKVRVMVKSIVKNIERDKLWQIDIEDNNQLLAKSLILTTGGKAAFQFGSSGDGLFWAKKLGHTIEPLYAALVPIETAESWPATIQGLKVEARIKAFYKNNLLAEKTGDLLFTHYGLSGPAVMSLSGDFADKADDKQNNVRLEIDFFPETGTRELHEKINSIFQSNGAKTALNNLRGMIAQNLLELILNNMSLNKDKKSAEFSNAEIGNIIKAFKSTVLHLKKLRPLKEAQVTRGGICLKEIENNTLESKKIQNLFFAGEIIDIDGDSGGFNLQWAWSSGYVAGSHASNQR
ncbi:MAG: NAD(P)/FAD-dependent oxidoreductase [Patescibacteria group bacterium]|nr:NAD(P)/FAD-dependent oxidoreductase [Patescibacteria group bacterium]